jgi:N-dimethylarginine dimethylaminohydrolase
MKKDTSTVVTGVSVMSQPRILMCPPDFYGIEYEINPWMSVERGAVLARARQQWQTLYQTLVDHGVQVDLMTPQPGLPDLVFTANAGLIFGNQFYSSRFRHLVRARETPHFDDWFAGHGFEVLHLPQDMYFEGAGDALFCGETLFAGYRIRSDVRGHQYLGQKLRVQVLPLELVDDRFYHLDTCFCPLASGVAIYFPGAFDEYGRKVLQSHVPRLVPVAEPEAARFGCNAVVVGKTVIINSGCEQLSQSLRELGYTAIAIELDEFLKSGGSAKCLTLRLDGEEAAAWKNLMIAQEPAKKVGIGRKVRHVVLLKFKPRLAADTIQTCFDALRRLRDVIPGLEDFTGGPNISTEGLSKGFTHSFVMTFRDRAARDEYLPHLEHEKVKQLVLPHVDDVVVLDFEE